MLELKHLTFELVNFTGIGRNRSVKDRALGGVDVDFNLLGNCQVIVDNLVADSVEDSRRSVAEHFRVRFQPAAQGL